MEAFKLPSADGRMYAFHIAYESWEAIELFTKQERGMRLNQAFYAPTALERVNPCMVTAESLRINEVYTVEDLSSIPFPYPVERSALTEEEIALFARRGLKVVTLDRIS